MKPKKIINGKKGMELLGEHTVELIIAAFCIIVLVYLGMMVYGLVSKNNQRALQAESTLAAVNAVIVTQSSTENIGKSAEYNLESPAKWYILSWPDVDGKIPDRCIFRTCLCICEDNTLESCQSSKSGKCIVFNLRHF